MVIYGDGQCESGYYMGGNDLGTESEQACKDVCMKEDLCSFVSFKIGESCSRYKHFRCKLLVGDDFQKAHRTYKKIRAGT